MFPLFSRRFRTLRIWLFPFSVLLGAGFSLFTVTFWIDASAQPDPSHVFDLILRPNPASAAATLSNAGEVVAAVLAIAITVVAIVVELAANRYTHRITELFVSSPVNFVVMGFFVVTAGQCLWVNLTFDPESSPYGFVPYVGIRVAMVLLTLCLLILLPYFAFVFAFLHPVQVVDRIRRHAVRAIRRASRYRRQPYLRDEAVRGIEQLGDIALNAMEHKDKAISMAGIDALSALVLDYQTKHRALADTWFRIDGSLASNPDFVSLAEEVLEDITRRKIWFELKVLRQYESLFNEALNRLRAVNYLVAINTRRVAECGAREGRRELLDLGVKFLNTYLRSTINAGDVRTAYYVLNEYRLLAQATLAMDDGRYAVEIARYFKYYGQLAFHKNLPFLLETAAYDLCTLNEIAFERGSPATDELCKVFLQVDKESEGDVQERSLRGVRKAQVKLASFYLTRGEEKRARNVYQDMMHEPADRLASIRDELLMVTSREFWEISDRGVNFDFLSADRKTKMLEFFSWFGDKLPAEKPISVPPR